MRKYEKVSFSSRAMSKNKNPWSSRCNEGFAFQLLQLTLFCSIEKIDLLSEAAASYNYNSVATNKTRQAVIISRPGRPKAHQGSSDYFLSQKLKEGTSIDSKQSAKICRLMILN